ncbi:MAG: hypothetical protein ACREAU_00500 [Nitrosopumilaceae archaeon]
MKERKVVDYKVIQGQYLGTFEKFVREALKDGWTLHGDIHMFGISYHQCLVKYETVVPCGLETLG